MKTCYNIATHQVTNAFPITQASNAEVALAQSGGTTTASSSATGTAHRAGVTPGQGSFGLNQSCTLGNPQACPYGYVCRDAGNGGGGVCGTGILGSGCLGVNGLECGAGLACWTLVNTPGTSVGNATITSNMCVPVGTVGGPCAGTSLLPNWCPRGSHCVLPTNYYANQLNGTCTSGSDPRALDNYAAYMPARVSQTCGPLVGTLPKLCASGLTCNMAAANGTCASS